MKSELVREVLMLNGYRLVYTFIAESEPFRLVLWNNDSWDKPLPENIMENYPEELILDFTDDVLTNCYTEEGEIHISVYFDDEIYHKKLFAWEIIAVSNLSGYAYHVNNFNFDDFNEALNKEVLFEPLEIIETISENENLEPQVVGNSLFSLLKNNPEYASNFQLN